MDATRDDRCFPVREGGGGKRVFTAGLAVRLTHGIALRACVTSSGSDRVTGSNCSLQIVSNSFDFAVGYYIQCVLVSFRYAPGTYLVRPVRSSRKGVPHPKLGGSPNYLVPPWYALKSVGHDQITVLRTH